jgi:hypothetical protein
MHTAELNLPVRAGRQRSVLTRALPWTRSLRGRVIRAALMSSLVAALVLMAILPARAATFSPDAPRRLTSSGRGTAFARALVRTGPDSAAVVFSDIGGGRRRVFVRRTSDDGLTWDARTRISGPGRASHAAVGGDAQGISVAWAEGRDCQRGPCRVWVASSLDGGQTFTARRPLTRRGVPGIIQVARSGQLVVIGFTDWRSGRMRLRVSHDGGATFAAPVSLGTTQNRPFSGTLLDGLVSVAIGDGVSHVAYFDRPHRLRVRRSLDDGATWGPSQRLGDSSVYGVFGLSLVAGGDDAVIAYTDRSRGFKVKTQVSLDRGVYWRRATRVSPRDVRWSGWPVAARRFAGSYLVAYELCADATCSKVTMRVVSTSDSGQSWPDGYAAGSRPARMMLPTGIGWTRRVILTYVLGTRGGRVYDVYAEAADDDTVLPASVRRRRAHGS